MTTVHLATVQEAFDATTLHILNPDLDQRNLLILKQRADAFARRNGPQVGDFVRMLDGTFRRFTHDWCDDIQTTVPQFSGDDSFYLSDGGASFSGALDSAIPKSKLRKTCRTHTGVFWFFRNDYATAHNGVSVIFPCRVWEMLP